MSYLRAPHGGYTITHHPDCLEDCGHSDCMGCCGCPPDQIDADTIDMLRDQNEWIGQWFATQIADARTTERAAVLDALLEQMRPMGNKITHPWASIGDVIAVLERMQKETQK